MKTRKPFQKKVEVTLKDFYGAFQINEPILIELIKSKPIQRLKHISHQGMIKTKNTKIKYSRYEHSIGVMLLLRKLGASVEEQTAGLLHDVSHTAFSHTTDMLFGNYEKQNLQDSLHKKTIKNKTITTILKKHGYKPSRISQLKLFPLLEKEAPNLCADRLDYSLRDMHHLHINIKPFIKHLTVHNNEIIFTSQKQAERYAKNYARLQNNLYASKKELVKVKILTTALQQALQQKIISKKDIINGVDSQVINKIKKSQFENTKQLLKNLQNENYKISQGDTLLKAKFRYVNPKFIKKNSIQKLANAKPSYKKLIQKNQAKNAKGYKIKITFKTPPQPPHKKHPKNK
jgi:HD superfamily phosphohydrolase